MTAGTFDVIFRKAARTALVKRRKAESGKVDKRGSWRDLKASTGKAPGSLLESEERDLGPPPEHIAMRQTFGLLA